MEPSTTRPTLTPMKARIVQAVQDMHFSGRTVMRAPLASHLGLKFSVMDEHVTWLCNRGILRRVGNGVLEPGEVFPIDRPVSKTVLVEGWVKVEVGDEPPLTLTPGEARKVGLALYGDAMEFAHIKGERETYDTVHTLRHQVRALEKRLGETAKSLAELSQSRTKDLFAEPAPA